MRFRADVSQPMILLQMIQTFSKLQQKCDMMFTETDMHIVCHSDISEGGIYARAQIKVEALFSQYRIQSNADNTIFLSVATDALLIALRSASNYSEKASSGVDIILRLAKKHDQAVMSMEISGQSRSGKPVRITHDIQIEVFRTDVSERFAEPLCPEPEVQVLLPPIGKVRTVVDRLQVHSDLMLFQADGSGTLQLSATNDDVSVMVEWHKLQNPPLARVLSSQDPDGASQAPVERDPEEKYRVLVAFKSFQKFLNSHQLSTHTMASLCQNHALILYVYMGDDAEPNGVMIFYIPAVMEGD
ncbi:hypothetical protein QCA50_006292 [Cerrena zonata]|uniref:Checkpoint protein n=1 Tax=Cerrena zonata TaxID=2478898 RepID=A0AAW0GJ55_9APHY